MKFIKCKGWAEEVILLPVEAVGHIRQERPNYPECVVYTYGGKVTIYHTVDEVAEMIRAAKEDGDGRAD